jgi:transglutaminase family enzyme
LQTTRLVSLVPTIVRPKTKLLYLDGCRALAVPVAEKPSHVSQLDWEALCRVNDAIVKRVRYDHDRALSTNPRRLQTPQETLARGLGICMDFAALFEASARRVNLKAKSVISDSMNHAWNMVHLGGEWWNVDVTWNAGGIFASGSQIPESARTDPDFRRRYLLTNSDSEATLLTLGLLGQTHMAKDIRDIDFTRTLHALALIARIETLLDDENPPISDTRRVGINSNTGRPVRIPIGDREEQIARLYEEYLRLEESYPLAVSFRLGIRSSYRATDNLSKRQQGTTGQRRT